MYSVVTIVGITPKVWEWKKRNNKCNLCGKGFALEYAFCNHYSRIHVENLGKTEKKKSNVSFVGKVFRESMSFSSTRTVNTFSSGENRKSNVSFVEKVLRENRHSIITTVGNNLGNPSKVV